MGPISGSHSQSFIEEVKAAAGVIGCHIDVFTVASNREIDAEFASLVQNRADALLVASDAFLLTRLAQLVGLSLRHAMPTLYPWREAVEIGGLMSYGSSFADLFRQAGIYSGRILKGEKPADLPVIQPTRFEFIVNLQTAKTIGLDVPPTLLALADEVIE